MFVESNDWVESSSAESGERKDFGNVSARFREGFREVFRKVSERFREGCVEVPRMFFRVGFGKVSERFRGGFGGVRVCVRACEAVWT